MMAEWNIRTVTDLGRRLHDIGLDISSQQLARVVNDMPQRINTDLLAGLLTVLDCTPADLLQIREPADSYPMGGEKEVERRKEISRAHRPSTLQRRRPPRAPKPAETDDDITGPAITPFPLVEHT